MGFFAVSVLLRYGSDGKSKNRFSGGAKRD